MIATFNFLTFAFEHGFSQPKDFKVKDNWFGVSLYNPLAEFTRGNKRIAMSLGGAMPHPHPPDIVSPETWRVIDSGKAMYIGLFDGDDIVYQTWNGVPPREEIMRKFVE